MRSRAFVDEGLLETDTEAGSICFFFSFFFEDDEPGRQDGAKAMFADLLNQNPALLEYVLRRLRFYKDHLFNMFSLLWDALE